MRGLMRGGCAITRLLYVCPTKLKRFLAGESPVTVIAKKPCSQSQCVAVMRGAKRDDGSL